MSASDVALPRTKPGRSWGWARTNEAAVWRSPGGCDERQKDLIDDLFKRLARRRPVGEDQLVADEVERESRDALGHVLARFSTGAGAGERLAHHLAAAACELLDDRVGRIVGHQVVEEPDDGCRADIGDPA